MNDKCPEWKKTIHGTAIYLTSGNWKPYSYLVHISNAIIDNGIRNKRLIINCPPRHGKSTLISQWLPVWFLETAPDQNIILASYEYSVAEDWGRRVRDVLESKETWTSVRQDVRKASRWYTPEGGAMYCAGFGGALTGRGAQLIIVDDPIKNWEQAQSATQRRHVIEWFKSTLYTRAEPGAAIIIIQTRWHQHDLAGWLTDEHTDDWKVIDFPAVAEREDELGRKEGEILCPERFNLDAIQKIKNSLGSHMFAALYQQRPVPIEGSIIKEEWLKYWDTMPTCDRIIQSWDATFKDTKSGSYVVGQVWGQRGSAYYLLDQHRQRMDFVNTLQTIGKLTQRWPESRAKLIEDKANGPAIISALKSQISGIKPVNPRGSKEQRAHAVSPLFEAGNVYLPNPNLYPWVNDYIDELTNFPSSANDDQIDATTQALDYLDTRSASEIKNINLPDLSVDESSWAIL